MSENNLKRDFDRIFLTDELGEVNWCQDRLTAEDVEYVRADLVAQQPGSLTSEGLREVFREHGFHHTETGIYDGLVADLLASAGPKSREARYRVALEESFQVICQAYNGNGGGWFVVDGKQVAITDVRKRVGEALAPAKGEVAP